MSDVTPTPLLQVATGFMAAKQLFVASEIGLFEQLADSPATLDELAARTGIHSRPLRIVADAMVALTGCGKRSGFGQDIVYNRRSVTRCWGDVRCAVGMRGPKRCSAM
jgi:hypothetical protein